MDKQTISNNDRNNELVAIHQQWLQHPCTKEALKLIESCEKALTDNIATHALDTDISDAKIRYYGVQLRNTANLRKILFTTEKFVAKLQTIKQ